MDDSVTRSLIQMPVRDRVLSLESPKIMGILNATPDSFSDGGEYNSVSAALRRIEEMVSQGAAIIDVGAESTRPGSDPVSEQQELNRVLPILQKAVPQFPETLFSIDTTKFTVAREALKLGVHLVNDISGLQQESRLAEVCGAHNAGYVLMHSQGNPKTMQDEPVYDNVVEDIKTFFEQQIKRAENAGLKNIILDPGIGFGKTQQHNLDILKNLDQFSDLGYPLMVGASRKSMIGKILGNRAADDRLTGTVAVHYHAMMKGVNIIRVHDVKEANDSILVYNALN